MRRHIRSQGGASVERRYDSSVQRQVAIIGAGISGLSCAVVFGERGYRAVIFAEEMPMETTSAAGAIWFPYDALPEELVTAWALFSYGRLVEIARDAVSGVSLIELLTVSPSDDIAVPAWAAAVGHRRVQRHELDPPFRSGYSMTVPLMDTTVYLPWLRKRVEALGGSFERRRLDRLEDVPKTFDLIVNCSGFGARELVKDADLRAHRGQVVLVRKIDRTWAMVCDEPLMYILPRSNDCVLGGVNVEEDALPPDTPATILDRCQAAGLAGPLEMTGTKIGIRPYRTSGVRLEREVTQDGRPVVHNYGHGGCGFSVSWGCAHNVVELAQLLAVGFRRP